MIERARKVCLWDAYALTIFISDIPIKIPTEGEIAVVDVTANDLPPDLIIVDVSQPDNGGTCAITDYNQIIFAPDEGFFGQIDCTYRACVPGTTDCDDGTLIIDVIESPDIPPIAVDDPGRRSPRPINF